MGLFFKSRKEKELEKIFYELNQHKKQGRFECRYCGTISTITYYGSNDTYTCRRCGMKNYCE